MIFNNNYLQTIFQGFLLPLRFSESDADKDKQKNE